MDERIRLHTQLKKEIPAVKVKDHCDLCGKEIIEPPYVVREKTICQPCFWDWLAKITVRKDK